MPELPPRLSEDEVLALAHRYLPSARKVTAIYEDGFDHIVYAVDNEIVLKVSRPGEHPILLQREALILKELGGTPGLPIPRFIGAEVGRDASDPHVCMTLIEGKQLEALPDLAEDQRRGLL